MALTKIKQEKTAPELENARSRLDGVLQYLMEKADDSPSSSEDECNKALPEVMMKKEPSPVSSPAKKQTQRTQRKRRRKDDVTTKNSNSYVMKLFDRSVDLAQFTEQTPLYPICRAWINNKPNMTVSTKSEPQPVLTDTNKLDEKFLDDAGSKDVYQLPPPAPSCKGDLKDLRIPSPIPQPQEQFVICSDEQNAPSKETLMAKHMVRWRAVRQKWKQAAQANEERYKESGAILKAIFER